MPKKQVTIPIFIPHLGCRHKCCFCNQGHTGGSAGNLDAEYIKNKIDTHLMNIPSSVERIETAFFGGSFTGIDMAIQEKILAPVHEYLIKGRIHGIRVSTRPDYITPQKLDLLKKYGVYMVELGVQSFSAEVLNASKRGHGPEDIFNAVELLKKYGFSFILQLMPGLPGDSEERSLKSAAAAALLAPAGVRIYPAVVVRDTELMDLYGKGLYTPLSMEEAVELCRKIHGIMAERNIPVIRTGLHPVDGKELHNIIAGPYHPSFGFFVKSRIKRAAMESFLDRYFSSPEGITMKPVTIVIPWEQKEEYIGYRHGNIEYLKGKYPFLSGYRIEKCGELSVENN